MRTSSGRKKALAVGGLALGLAGSGLRSSGRETVAEPDGERLEMQQDGDSPDTALVFVNDYKPGVGFQPVSRVQQPTVNQILGYVDPVNPNQGNGAVVDPADWNGYIVNFTGCGPGNYNLIFLREGVLQQGQTYSFTTNAVYFSNQLQLLEARLQTGTGQTGAEAEGAEGTEEGAETAEETTPEETTTTEETTAETTDETTTTEGTTTETTDGTTTTTTEETTTTTEGTPTTTPPDETTTTTETPTENGTTTTEEVVVNATETENGE